MSDPAQPLILFANEAFYAAFAGADLGAMHNLWAEEAPLACLHPGAAPLFDRDEIMNSWAQILGGGPTDISCRLPRIVSSTGTALVVCYEVIGRASSRGALVATNGFVQERGRWRMVLHQAGPTPGAPEGGGSRAGGGRLN